MLYEVYPILGPGINVSFEKFLSGDFNAFTMRISSRFSLHWTCRYLKTFDFGSDQSLAKS